MSPPAQDNRSNDAVMLELIKTIQADMSAVKASVSETQTTLANHIATEPREWAIVLENLMKKSFPNADADGHREAHEATMLMIRERAGFWRSIRADATKWGILGAVSWLAYHAWIAFLHGPAK